MDNNFNPENDIIYICRYKGTNMGAFAESSIIDKKDFDTFMDEYAKTGSTDTFLQQVDDAENMLNQYDKDNKYFDETERNVICLNIISLVRQGVLENDELFGYIKVSCKDKKVVLHM